MRTFAIVLTAFALAAAAGCNNNNKKSSAGNPDGATADLKTPPPPPAIQPVQPIQPIQPVQPVVSDSSPVVTPAVATPAHTGGVYTVQKGDTLFKIARAKYNDPSAVKKIKDANPGLDADHIKVGQKINLP